MPNHTPGHQIDDNHEHLGSDTASSVTTTNASNNMASVAYTADPTANTFPIRDSSGRFAVADPSAADDADNKGSRDTAITAGLAGQALDNHSAGTTPLAYIRTNSGGDDTEEVVGDAAAATADTVAERDSNGDVIVPATPTAANAAGSKTYIDNDITVTVNADAGNTMTIDIADGRASAKYLAELRDADGLHALAAAWTMAETGDGAEVSTTAKPTLIFALSAGGAAQLTVTDVATGTAATLYLTLTPLDAAGTTKLATLVFTT